MNRLFRSPFLEAFMASVAKAMTASGRGYKRDSMRNTGIGDDRRKDKLDDNRPKWLRAYSKRYASVPLKQSARQQRKAGLMP